MFAYILVLAHRFMSLLGILVTPLAPQWEIKHSSGCVVSNSGAYCSLGAKDYGISHSLPPACSEQALTAQYMWSLILLYCSEYHLRWWWHNCFFLFYSCSTSTLFNQLMNTETCELHCATGFTKTEPLVLSIKKVKKMLIVRSNFESIFFNWYYHLSVLDTAERWQDNLGREMQQSPKSTVFDRRHPSNSSVPAIPRVWLTSILSHSLSSHPRINLFH